MVMDKERGVGGGYLDPERGEVVVVYLDEKIKADIAQTMVKELAVAEKPQKQIVFKHTLEPGAGLTDHQHLPMLKEVKSITIHWPDGCGAKEGALVDVAVGYSQDKRLLPEVGYLALNDVTPTWTINKETDSDTLWVYMFNGDAVNPHTISVIVDYEEAQV